MFSRVYGVVISGVISRASVDITQIRGLILPQITTHESHVDPKP